MSSRRGRLAAFALAAAASRALPAAADDASVLSASDVQLLEDRGWLERDPAQVARVLGPYADRVFSDEHVRAADVRIAKLEGLECVLGRVAARQLGVAQFFSNALFRADARSSLTVLVDAPTLVALDRVFNLHTIFPATVRGADGAPVAHMLFLLAGQGKMLVGYDRGATYPHPDGVYSIFGNRDYAVYPFLRMTIGTHDGHPALLQIGVADGPDGALQEYHKRVLLLSPAIHALYVDGRHVTADTSVINRSIEPPPVEWLGGPAHGAARLQQLGCPAVAEWPGPLVTRDR